VHAIEKYTSKDNKYVGGLAPGCYKSLDWGGLDWTGLTKRQK